MVSVAGTGVYAGGLEDVVLVDGEVVALVEEVEVEEVEEPEEGEGEGRRVPISTSWGRGVPTAMVEGRWVDGLMGWGRIVRREVFIIFSASWRPVLKTSFLVKREVIKVL